MVDKQTELTDLFKMLMQEKTPEYESKFFKKLNETVFWIPDIIEEPDKGKRTFAVLVTGDGRKFIPTFLHKKSKLGRFEEEQLVEISYNKLKYVLIDSKVEISGMVIDPFEENIILDRKLMEIIDSKTMGMTLRREDHTGKLILRKPELIPKGLEDALQNFFENCLEVEAVWLMMARGEYEPDEHWMLLIDFQGEKTALFPPVAELMKPYMKPGEKFELIQKMPDVSANEIEPARIYIRSGK